jgi:type I restriction enzyme S subunit
MEMNGWPESRLRYLLAGRRSTGKTRKPPEVTDVTFLPMEAIGEHGSLDLSIRRNLGDVSSGYTEFSDGDVLVAKITPCFENGKGALAMGLSNGFGYGTTELHVLTPGDRLEGRFLYYVTASESFRRLGEAEMSGAAGQKRVPEEFIKNYRIRVPSLTEQRSISDYLDRETSRLDMLIAAKERLLLLISQKRNSLITHAVTQGINTNVQLKDSGISWLGKVPVNWEVQRTKWLFTERDERSVSGDEEMLTVSHVTGVTRRADKDVNMFQAESNEGYKICYQGDLVINTLWAWMGAMGVAPVHGIVSPAYNVYVPKEQLYGAYVDALVRTAVFAQEVTRYSKGVWSSRMRLYPEDFFEVWMAVPPLDEQRAIVAYISVEGAKLEEVSRAAGRSIQLLKERRGALITAAVSGKLDVN